MKAARQKHYRAGLRAEYVACATLMLKGYWPVAMRYKTSVGEIDLILRRRRTLVFVEVKARKSRADAAHAVHAKNQSRVVRASQHFLIHHPRYQDFQVRFDVVLVAWYKKPHHVIHAFDEPI